MCCLLGMTAMLAVPVYAADLPPDQAAIVTRLRGPLQQVATIQYQASVRLILEGGRELRLEVLYAMRAGHRRVLVLSTSSTELADLYPTSLEQATYLWDGDRVALREVDGWVEFAAGATSIGSVDPVRPEWDSSPVGPYLTALNALSEPTSFQWRATGDSTDEGWEVYEARLPSEVRPTEPVAIAGLRLFYDPACRAVMRTAAFDAQGHDTTQTTYSDLYALPDGSAVPLTSATTVPASRISVRLPGEGGDTEAHIWCPGTVTVTHFRWSEEHGIRLPTDREVRDDEGRLLCAFTFHDHKAE